MPKIDLHPKKMLSTY